MRFCLFKIIFLINVILCFSQAVQSKEYDLSFDVRKTKSSEKRRTLNSSPLPSTNSWRLGMQAPLLPEFLEGSGELVYGKFDEQSAIDFSDRNKYLLTLGVSGSRNIFGYGFNFYSVGQQYKGIFDSKYSQKKGLSGYDSWVSFNIEDLQIKTKYLESWSNISDDVDHIQSFDSWYEVESSYPLMSSPLMEMSFAYGLGKRRSFKSFNHIQTFQGSLNLIRTKFRFVADYLKFSTELKKSSSKNDIGNQKYFQQEMLYFTSTLFPLQPISIISSYRYSIDRQSSSFYRSKLNKIESSLGVAYSPSYIPINLKFTSGYKNHRNENNTVYKDMINFGGQLDWESIGFYTGLKNNWTINFKYKDTIDYLHPTTSYSDLSFNLLWYCPIPYGR